MNMEADAGGTKLYLVRIVLHQMMTNTAANPLNGWPIEPPQASPICAQFHYIEKRCKMENKPNSNIKNVRA